MLRYAITDRKLLGATETERAEGLIRQAKQLAARGNIDYLQLREKDLPPVALAILARQILEALRTHASDPMRRPKLLINSRADVAIAVRADGVHLTSSPGELTPTQVRQLYSDAGLPPPTISLSCHTLDDIARAADSTPNLILFGPVFEKQVNNQRVTEGSGLELLHQACAATSPISVLALGGVTEENAADCLAAGAAGIAAIRMFAARIRAFE